MIGIKIKEKHICVRYRKYGDIINLHVYMHAHASYATYCKTSKHENEAIGSKSAVNSKVNCVYNGKFIYIIY